MSVSISRYLLCWAMVVTVPGALLGQAPSQTPSAILHSQGGVWVNAYEARDSSAIFVGDLLETKPGFSASLSLEGSEISIQPQSVVKFQGDFLVLDHGSVALGTSRSFKVKVNCISVVPVLNDWTQYDVTDVSGTVQVAARKNEVRVELGLGRGTPSAQPGASNSVTVHEGEQSAYHESEVCGTSRPTGAGSGLNPKWIEIGAGAIGGGVLICVLLCRGGSKPQISPDQP